MKDPTQHPHYLTWPAAGRSAVEAVYREWIECSEALQRLGRERRELRGRRRRARSQYRALRAEIRRMLAVPEADQ